LAKPGRDTLQYGGNTACTEIRTDDGSLIVLDCGTGANDLGRQLLLEKLYRGHLLITHTHWDHIQGFPFFGPLFHHDGAWSVYAPAGLGTTLEETLSGQMRYEYFPVTLDQLGAQIDFHDLTEGEFNLGSVRVTARYLNHPAPTLGYRLEVGGATVVYASDHEPHSQHTHARTNLPVHREDIRHLEFLADADLVIHDAQYTAEEYLDKVGWGHTAMEVAVEFALAANVHRLALFHHDPFRDDDTLNGLVEMCREMVAARGGNLDVCGAAEGVSVDLPEGSAPRPRLEAGTDLQALVPTGLRPKVKTKVLIAVKDPALKRMLPFALRPEGFDIVNAADGKAAVEKTRKERPSLVLMEWDMPGLNGLEVCRALRDDEDDELIRVPVVLITERAEAGEISAAFEAGVTDYVSAPFTPQYIRSRVYAWIRRAWQGQTPKPTTDPG